MYIIDIRKGDISELIKYYYYHRLPSTGSHSLFLWLVGASPGGHDRNLFSVLMYGFDFHPPYQS